MKQFSWRVSFREVAVSVVRPEASLSTHPTNNRPVEGHISRKGSQVYIARPLGRHRSAMRTQGGGQAPLPQALSSRPLGAGDARLPEKISVHQR